LHLMTASFPLTLVASYEEGTENKDPVPCLVDLKQDEYPPVSPGLAETILALDPLLALDTAVSATVHATAFGLISTIHQRMANSAQKFQEAEHKIAQLKAINQQQQADNRQLRAQLGLLTVPHGFERNQGQVAATVPTGGGQMVVPEWIRSVGNGQVELLAGREPGEPTYAVKLFLHPDYTETNMDTAALWFLALLTGQDGSFHTLAEAARCLDNLAAVAEIYCYRHLEQERTELTTELNRVSNALSAIRDQLDSCQYRLEWAQIPVLLQHLENHMSFTPSIANLGRRRRGPRQLHVDGGASP